MSSGAFFLAARFGGRSLLFLALVGRNVAYEVRDEDQADPKPAVEQKVIETDPVATSSDNGSKFARPKD
jgi:hypothetical protein